MPIESQSQQARINKLTLEANAERIAMADASAHPFAEIDRELYRLDRHLSLKFFGENASAPGIVPGRWHIRRENPNTIDTYYPLETPDGEYRDPTMNDVEKLKGADLWKGDGMWRMRRRDLQQREKAERSRQRHDEDRREEIADRIKAIGNPGVSFANQGKGWSYRAGAKR
jgi:hypothetical protein